MHIYIERDVIICVYIQYISYIHLMILQWTEMENFCHGACTQHGTQLHGFLAGILHALGPQPWKWKRPGTVARWTWRP